MSDQSTDHETDNTDKKSQTTIRLTITEEYPLYFFSFPSPPKKKNIIPERSFANKKIHKHFFKWAESHNHENDDDDNYQDESSSSTNVSSDNDDHSNDSDSSSDESGAYESFDDDDSSNDSGDSEYVIDPYHQFENSAYKNKIE